MIVSPLLEVSSLLDPQRAFLGRRLFMARGLAPTR
jgi:hypothetical protein